MTTIIIFQKEILTRNTVRLIFICIVYVLTPLNVAASSCSSSDLLKRLTDSPREWRILLPIEYNKTSFFPVARIRASKGRL